jgi:hypothetical protein
MCKIKLSNAHEMLDPTDGMGFCKISMSCSSKAILTGWQMEVGWGVRLDIWDTNLTLVIFDRASRSMIV